MPAVSRPRAVEYGVARRRSWLRAARFVDAAIRAEADHSEEEDIRARLLLSAATCIREYIQFRGGRESNASRRRVVFIRARVISCKRVTRDISARTEGADALEEGAEFTERKCSFRAEKNDPRRGRENGETARGLPLFLGETLARQLRQASIPEADE